MNTWDNFWALVTSGKRTIEYALTQLTLVWFQFQAFFNKINYPSNSRETRNIWQLKYLSAFQGRHFNLILFAPYFFNPLKHVSLRSILTLSITNSDFPHTLCIYQYSETNVMHFLFNLLRIKGSYTPILVQPTDITRTQYTKYRLCSVSWGWASNAQTCKGP
jgi:hypothetical protein